MYPLSLGPDALEIDGLREDAEVLFILTTNRPDQIEPALASRPRRIDKAIEFTSESALAELAATWPTSRLVEIYNSLAGVTPVKKFKDRATAVSRIWKAIQTLGDAAPAADSTRSRTRNGRPAPMIAEGPATKVPRARFTPQLPDASTEEAPANNDASPATDAPGSATDEKLLRVLARAFDGLSPEQQEAKWVVLRNALATRKTADAATKPTVTAQYTFWRPPLVALLTISLNIAALRRAKRIGRAYVLRPVGGNALSGFVDIHPQHHLDGKVLLHAILNILVILASRRLPALRSDVIKRIRAAHLKGHQVIQFATRMCRHSVLRILGFLLTRVRDTVPNAFGREFPAAESCHRDGRIEGAWRAFRVWYGISVCSFPRRARSTCGRACSKTLCFSRYNARHRTGCAEASHCQDGLLRVNCQAREDRERDGQSSDFWFHFFKTLSSLFDSGSSRVC